MLYRRIIKENANKNKQWHYKHSLLKILAELFVQIQMHIKQPDGNGIFVSNILIFYSFEQPVWKCESKNWILSAEGRNAVFCSCKNDFLLHKETCNFYQVQRSQTDFYWSFTEKNIYKSLIHLYKYSSVSGRICFLSKRSS